MAWRKDGIHVAFDLTELVRADITSRYNAYRVGIMSGFLKPNEARVDDGRDPDPDGDKLLQPTNMAVMPAANRAAPRPMMPVGRKTAR